VASVLARAGWRVSARSVCRYRRERLVPSGPPAPARSSQNSRPVIARLVHHIWMMDVSVIRQFLEPDLYMAAVFDAFSRVPLCRSVFDRAPSAFDMVRLLRSTARVFTAPKYLSTDRGGAFTGDALQCMVKRFLIVQIVQRFASAENLYARSRLERSGSRSRIQPTGAGSALRSPVTTWSGASNSPSTTMWSSARTRASVGPRSENGASVCRPPTRSPASLPEAG
jgi:hypothetical protein